MNRGTELLPDLTGELTFTEPSELSVDVLLEYGVVVTDGAVPDEEIEGVRKAVDTLFFESLHTRILYKILENMPSARIRDTAHHRHSAQSQFDPARIPERLAGAAPAVDRIIRLDSDFFRHERLREIYRHHPHRLNIADVSRAAPGQKAFVIHQDSNHVSRLGHILQPVDTRWTIIGGEKPSRKDFSYTFVAKMGSVVTTLERSGPLPTLNLPPGHGLEYYIEDGSEVHGGDNLTGDVRHRLGLFAEQPRAEDRLRDPLVRAVVATEAWLRRRTH